MRRPLMTPDPAAPPPAPRLASMDQFRGLTILGMFAVHYSGGFDWGVDLSPIFRHHGFYLSVGDLFFPWFHFAAGFSLRLALLRRLAAGARPLRTGGPSAGACCWSSSRWFSLATRAGARRPGRTASHGRPRS